MVVGDVVGGSGSGIIDGEMSVCGRGGGGGGGVVEMALAGGDREGEQSVVEVVVRVVVRVLVVMAEMMVAVKNGIMVILNFPT